MPATAISKNGVTIRLTDERWLHIIEGHGELEGLQQFILDTIAHPERILAGSLEELIAVRAVESEKWLVVVYRESEADGFVITAFVTRRKHSLDKRQQLWP